MRNTGKSYGSTPNAAPADAGMDGGEAPSAVAGTAAPANVAASGPAATGPAANNAGPPSAELLAAVAAARDGPGAIASSAALDGGAAPG